jgi:hypothetical protein
MDWNDSNTNPEVGRGLLVRLGFDGALAHVDRNADYTIKLNRCEILLTLANATLAKQADSEHQDEITKKTIRLRSPLESRRGAYWTIEAKKKGAWLDGNYTYFELCHVTGKIIAADRAYLRAYATDMRIDLREGLVDEGEEAKVVEQWIKLRKLDESAAPDGAYEIAVQPLGAEF